MKRSRLKKGDKSSVGGIVTEGIPFMSHEGTELTFLGASVNCPACKSTGHIVPIGPRLSSNFMGKQPALEGDLCACKCAPKPVMIASQSVMFESYEAHHLASMGYDAAGNPLPTEKFFDEQFQLLDTHTGKPLANVEYAIKRASGNLEHGVTDANGYTHRLAKTSEAEGVNIFCSGAEYA
ncbi:PAAR domain-containing protein [Paraburkholderia dinghuensis]|uniref:PAAR domain-containing protein n=2 Tax=Paraburkholderia dinghuensis TaxID=2305225 RepID=A0A3N6NUS4_9BURK|nr:PAAR domain-containing protein [Paraburkholderia dinghuensis]